MANAAEIASAGLSCGVTSPATPDTDELAGLRRQAENLEDALASVRCRLSPAAAASARPVAVVDRAACTLCGICASSCPNDAISMAEAAEVESVKCTGCGACVHLCPVHAIHLEHRASDR